MKKVFFYLKPYLGRMSLGLTIKFTGTIMDLLLPWILSYLIDEIIPKKNISLVLLYGFYMLVCSLIAWITNIVANRMASLVARNTTERIRHDLYARISYLSSRKSLSPQLFGCACSLLCLMLVITSTRIVAIYGNIS